MMGRIHRRKAMNVKVYTSTGCTWCARTKELLERAKITDYTEILWSDMSGDDQETFKNSYLEAQGFPVVFVDEEFVGGLVPFAKMLMQKGLVSAPKK